MARPRDLIGVVLFLGAIGIATKPGVVLAGGDCHASYVILGQAPALTGATTDWFNVFGEGFDPSVAATLAVSVAVIPWSIERPSSVQPAVTSFTMPAEHMSSGFKWSFRARDEKVPEVHVRITGKQCVASTVVVLSPPDTSTAPGVPAGRDPSPVVLLVLLVAAGGGACAMHRRLRSEQ